MAAAHRATDLSPAGFIIGTATDIWDDYCDIFPTVRVVRFDARQDAGRQRSTVDVIVVSCFTTRWQRCTADLRLNVCGSSPQWAMLTGDSKLNKEQFNFTVI